MSKQCLVQLNLPEGTARLRFFSDSDMLCCSGLQSEYELDEVPLRYLSTFLPYEGKSRKGGSSCREGS